MVCQVLVSCIFFTAEGMGLRASRFGGIGVGASSAFMDNPLLNMLLSCTGKTVYDGLYLRV